MIWFCLFLLLIFVIRINCTLDSCRQTFGSNQYDLNQLSHLTITGKDPVYGYVLTPCGLVPTDQCGQTSSSFESGMTACQFQTADPPRFESPMGFLDGYGKTPNLGFSENTDGPGTGVIMTMNNALCAGRERPVKVIFICDRSIKSPTNMEVVEGPPCEFNIKIKAAGACALQSGLSGGTIFIIILLVVIVVYVLGGVLYNRFKEKQTGLALLPHPSFWLLLVGLFRNGCRYTFTFLRTCGRGTSSSTYNSV